MTSFAGDTSLYTQIRLQVSKLSDSLLSEPNNSMLFFKRGNLLFDIEEWKKAEADISKAISLEPGNFIYYYKRGGTRDRLNKYSDAYEDYNKAIELNPAYHWAYLDRGLILNKSNVFKDADADFRHALQLQPNWGAALFCIGENFSDQDNVDSAMYYYKRAIFFDSLQYKAYNNLGTIYNKQKKYDLAIEQFDKALKVWSGYTFALTNRAQAKYDKGDKAGACADMKKAIDLGRKDKIPVYKLYCE